MKMHILQYHLLTFSLLVPWCYSLQHYRCINWCAFCECDLYCPSNDVDIDVNELQSDMDMMDHCSHKDRLIIDDNGYTYKKIHLIINFVDDRKSYLNFNENNGHTISKFIYSLDLSNKEYELIPISTYMENLHKINMSRNSLTKAELSNVHNLPVLEEIDFSYNTINTIDVDSLEYPFKEIKVLNLSHNNLVSIPDGIFSVSPKLETLDLSHNYVDTLSVLTFEGIRNLVNLYMSHNRISNLDNALLRFNFLEYIDLSHNAIERIKSIDFEKLINLRKLDLSSNNLQVIEKSAFNTMNWLKFVDISNNMIENIDEETFSYNAKLEYMNLCRNVLKELPTNLFKGKHLSTFTIQGNQLEGALVKGTFEGLNLVTEIDLSGQQLMSIENYAFFGLDKMNTLLLQNNKIHTISIDAFRNLQNLEVLDLSNNLLTNIDFEKKDLVSLNSLVLQHNDLALIKPEYFQNVNMLEFLDLSNNKIVQLEKYSFVSLGELINIQIFNNPISGSLGESTFDGLNSLPTLDISGTKLTTICNGSFTGMTQLKNLNISHSSITEIQYNSFLITGVIENLDLSFNRLSSFEINTTELVNLNTLLLNNNLLTSITSSSMKGLPRLTTLFFSHNNITDIQNKAFVDQIDLRHLDLSYNSELYFNISHLENVQNLAYLILSGIHTNITFEQIGDIPLSVLEMSHSGIRNISTVVLKRLKQLDTLVLSHNEIVNVEVGALSNIALLRQLDLSFNKINFIQPGAFKDNTNLFSLNISHNLLTAVSYGIFRGLNYLNTLDMSYNNIDSLESERFYEVRSLSVLTVDNNRISSIKADDFVGTSLSRLSIGGNPLPCNILVNLKKSNIPFVITAMKLDESSDENIDGVTCNMDSLRSKVISSSSLPENNKVLVDIRDILRSIKNYTARDITDKLIVTPVSYNNYSEYLLNLSKQFDKSDTENKQVLSNLTSSIMDANNNTSNLLDKMLKVLTSINTVRRTPVLIPKDNVTSDSFIPYINKVKQDLEDTIAIEKQNILTEVENKILTMSHKKSIIFESSPNHEALSSNVASDSKSLLFLEICVGIILFMLIGFIMYKFYRSGMFVPRGHSYSTRNLPEAMDNSTL